MNTRNIFKEMPEVNVGDEATGWYLSDCYPFEVIQVSASGKTIWLRSMRTIVYGKCEHYGDDPDKVYISDRNGKVIRASWRKKRGLFVGSNGNGMKFSIGKAREYRDPHF